MIGSTVGWVHSVFAFTAIVAGGAVVLLPKGTRWHRTLGHAYATSMMGLLASALFIYDLTGSWGVFHWAAVVGLATLLIGMGYALVRHPRRTWIEHHATWMSWSYVGLLAAFAAESATRFVMPVVVDRVPEQSDLWAVFWVLVVGASLAVAAVGTWLVKTRLPEAIRKAPQAMRRERERSASPS